MSDTPTPVVPAAWYPDPAGGPNQRWWDGTQWTEHYQQPYTVAGAVLRAPEGTKTNTPWIWAIIGVMVLAIIPALTINYEDYLAGTLNPEVSGSLVTTDLVLNLVSWVIAAVHVVLAFLDWRTLKALGVPRPFHWAWGFFALITPLVYVIGRSVVVRRRTGGGLAPLWAAIAVTVLGWIVSAVVVLPAFVAVFKELSL